MHPGSARGSKRRVTSDAHKHPRKITVAALAALAAYGGAIAPWARGDDWKGPGGGDWQLGSNWVDGTVPTASDWTFWTNLGTGTVTNSGGNIVSQGATFVNASGVITFDLGAANTWTQSLYTIMGDGASPPLQKPSIVLSSGTIVCNLFLIGNNDHTEAHATVDGASSLYHATGGVRVGSDSGSNSTLTLSNGGKVLGDTTSFVGLQTATGVQLNIQDPGSKMTVTAGMQVGGNIDLNKPNAGQNQINITNGGTLETGQFLVAVGGTNSTAGGNTVNVSGAGSQLTLTARTSPAAFSTLAAAVGFNNSDNTLNVNNGGAVVVNQGDVRVGNGTASLNNLVHMTSGSITMNGSGDLATSGSGRFDVRRGKLWLEGGTATLPGLLANTGATSQLQLDGGTLVVNNANVANGAPVALGNGSGVAMIYRMASLAGVSTFVDGLVIQSDGQLQGSGGISGNVTNNGIISPGASPGTINITGNLTLNPSGATNIELAGTGAGQFDQINDTGGVVLGGALNVSLINSFAPNAGDTFAFLNATGGITGTFSTISTPPVTGVDHWDVIYTPTAVYVQFVPEPTAMSVMLGCVGAALLAGRRTHRPRATTAG